MVLHPDVTRRAVLGGLLAATASRASAAGPDSPPSFDGARRQFTELRPLRSVPPTRLVGVDGRAADLARCSGR